MSEVSESGARRCKILPYLRSADGVAHPDLLNRPPVPSTCGEGGAELVFLGAIGGGMGSAQCSQNFAGNCTVDICFIEELDPPGVRIISPISEFTFPS